MRSMASWALAAMVAGTSAGPLQAAVITLSRTNGNTVTDTYIRWFNSATSTDGNSTATSAIAIGTDTYNSGTQYIFGRMLIYFDLSSIPNNATINSATLTLYSGGGDKDLPLNAYRLTSSFTSAATWKTRDGSTDWAAWTASPRDQDHVASAAAAGISGNNHTFNLTGDVQSFVNGTAPNDGWVIVGKENPSATTDQTWLTYISATTAYSNGNARPQLVVDYTPVPIPEPASMAILGLGGLLLMRRRKRMGAADHA